MSESKHASSGTFTVLQITDAHIKREPEGELLGMNTRDSFEAVLGLAAHDFPTDVDLVIASGDLAQDGSVEAYQYFKKRIDSLGVPVAWFPGNHDDRKNMTSVVGSGDEMQKVRHLGNWQFVFLDSLVTGKVHGHLAQSEVKVLEDALNANPDMYTVVCLHHHTIKVGSQWLDGSYLVNGDVILDMVTRFSQIKLVLCGHIHQEQDLTKEGARFLASPSTCIQFKPQSDQFAIDKTSPGYRWIRFFEDGTFDTGVNRADEFEFEIDMNSDGY